MNEDVNTQSKSSNKAFLAATTAPTPSTTPTV